MTQPDDGSIGDGIGDDKLDGLAAIAKFWDETEPRTTRLIKLGIIPAVLVGGRYLGSKAENRQAYRELTARRQAPQP